MNRLLFAFIIAGIVISIGLFVFVCLSEGERRMEDYQNKWDSCDYFVIINYNNMKEVTDCYSSYAYIRIKEDGRIGVFCFIDSRSSREHGIIYGYCNSREIIK